MVAISSCEGVLVFSLLISGESTLYCIVITSIFIQIVNNVRSTCRNGARTIGSDNRIQYEAESQSLGGRLYLNIDNPALCSGTVTRWEYCFYPPIDNGTYHILFAIYRQSDAFPNIPFYQSRSPRLNLTISIDNKVDEGFLCNSFFPAEQISVQQGDIIGICLPRTNTLDIVSDTSGEHLSGDRLLYREDDCSDIPGTIFHLPPLAVLAFQEKRVAHLYAQIGSKILFYLIK